METLKLEAKKRTLTGKAVSQLREKGLIPAVVYGKGLASITLEVAEQAFLKVFKAAGESTLIDLVLDGKTDKVLIQEVAHDPLSDKIVHADFHKISLTEKMHAKIPLVFIGESIAVKGLGGVLVKNVDELEVECLPTALVHEIPVDISKLVNFGDVIHLKDITVPPGIAVKHLHSEDPIVSVAEPRSEEEMKALEEKPVASVESVEVIKKEKAEGEEDEAPAAGAKPAKGGAAPGGEEKKK
jgi:large subunit ribosomal protein L25